MVATRGTMTLTDIMKPVLSILSHVIQKTSFICPEDTTMVQDVTYLFVIVR